MISSINIKLFGFKVQVAKRFVLEVMSKLYSKKMLL
jgi:hypothetical protein